MSLDKLKLRHRLAMVVCAAFLGMLAIVIGCAHDARSNLFESRKSSVRSGVEGMYNVIAFYQGEAAAGRMSQEDAQRLAKDAIRQARYGGKDGKTEYYYAYTLEGVGVAHPKRELEGQNMLEKFKDGQGRYILKDIIAALAKSPDAFVDGAFPRPGQQTPVPKLFFVKKFEPWGWFVGTGIYMDDLDEVYRAQLIKLVGFSVIPTVLIGILITLLSRSIYREIGGEPATAVSVMKEVADGNLSDLTVTTLQNAGAGSLLHILGMTVSAMRRLILEINQEATRLIEQAAFISRASREVSQAAIQQTDAHGSMAAAIQQLTVSAAHISGSTGNTQQDSRSAVELSCQGSDQVRTAAAAMERISQTVSGASSQVRELESRTTQISSIANVIKDIAGQTNLLALNAAIEAARAGEQGRGFAVVADEVRKLAERTSLATMEIEQMIAGIQAETIKAAGVMDAAIPEVTEGVKLADAAMELLSMIESGAKRTLAHIDDIAAATREQSNASALIAQRVEEVAQRVEATTASMQGTAQAAAQLETIASHLKILVGRFRI